MSLVMTEAASTPLQEHLEVLATSIGKVGLVVAVICFIVLLIRSAVLSLHPHKELCQARQLQLANQQLCSCIGSAGPTPTAPIKSTITQSMAVGWARHMHEAMSLTSVGPCLHP